MHEHIGVATILLILAVAGGLGERPPACCGTFQIGPAVLDFR